MKQMSVGPETGGHCFQQENRFISHTFGFLPLFTGAGLFIQQKENLIRFRNRTEWHIENMFTVNTIFSD